ncbi:hypothetical protein EDF56_10894 [Novosphingobium sp. PhB165]|uniref:MGH1-like glycoside hydrolase domain-containing protein n=1 Tax=Novosphingobium sp. PhB165 TaxID=2485105 RepID=UPI00104A85D9|nr:alpha-L-rhamnosidase [Novosphingobium sp. PhB165]TCM16106.1 hypothetical protein EDF56_10894 [Novosphingobium sp. PhB165]
MDRRSFLISTAVAGAGMAFRAHAETAENAPRFDAPSFRTGNARWQAAYDKALDVLAANVQTMPYVSKPVLIEGAVYQGIWQECGPHEALVYRKFRPDVARNSHMTFFELQRADGQLPANNKLAETGFGQIQMVVPIAATAWELARATGDGALLEAAYRACSAWDGWLMRYRNTRGTGLVEGFCTYDTGHDNSPRWAGMPNQCPNKDARTHHPIATLPRLCPDLSATVFGGRQALAEMARALGKTADADRWAEQAEHIRGLILTKLYVPEDAAFYDLDAKGDFVRVRSDILSRVCGEHVPDQALFDTLWTRQLHNPKAFWAPFPLTSVAMDDPAFVGSFPANSWGGATQALTALRAGRWFDHYGRSAEFTEMMDQWCDALQRDMTFRQQMNPHTGAFTHEEAPGYSPAALVMVDYSWRLVGVCEEADGLHWNVRPGHAAAQDARLSMRTDGGRTAAMVYGAGGADLTLDGAPMARISGGSARLVTDAQGIPRHLVGIDPRPQTISLRLAGRKPRSLTLRANEQVSL